MNSSENLDTVDTGSDPRFTEWRDHLVLRCRTDSHSRNHVPVVIESSDSRFWSNDLHERLDAKYDEFPAVDLCSPSLDQIKSTYVFGETTDTTQVVKHVLFPHLTYRRLKEAAKYNEFTRNLRIDDHATLLLLKERNIFQARLYRALACPEIADLADSEPLVLLGKVCNLTTKLATEKHRLGLFAGGESSAHYYTDLVVSVICTHQALADHRVLYFKRHHSLICYSQPAASKFGEEYAASVRKRLGFFDRLKLRKAISAEGYTFKNYLYRISLDPDEAQNTRRPLAALRFSPMPWNILKQLRQGKDSQYLF